MDSLITPSTGFICANCGSGYQNAYIEEVDGKLAIVVQCTNCGNEISFYGNYNN